MTERKPATCSREGCDLPRVSKGRRKTTDGQTVRIYRNVCDKHHQSEREERRNARTA